MVNAVGVVVDRRAMTARAITVKTAGAIVVRLAVAPETIPNVFHFVMIAVNKP